MQSWGSKPLLEANACLRAIVDAIPDAIYHLDLSGRFLRFKPSLDFEPVVPPSVFLGRRLREIGLPPEVLAAWTAALERVKTEPGYQCFEYQMTHDDGAHDLESRMIRVGDDRVIAIVRDITARKRAERDEAQARAELERTVRARTAELVAANLRLEEADRAKNAFLANMSHELRTPLNSVIGFTDIMLQGLTGELNAEQRTQLTIVQQAGRQLLALVDEVLDITRIEAGRVTPVARDFDVSMAMCRLLARLQPLADAKGLRLVLDAHAAPATLRADRELLEQALVKLLDNAFKFTEHGDVTLTVRALPDGGTEFAVADTGEGIAREELDRLLDAFEQGTSAQVAKPQGFGLGLAVVNEIMALLGGSLQASSEPGRGSVFAVSLPCPDGSGEAADPA